MRQLIRLSLFLFTFLFSYQAFAILSLELTRGIASAIPIAVTPFTTENGVPPQDISAIISNDLQHSGQFKLSNKNASDTYNVVVGNVNSLGHDRYQVSFQLLDKLSGNGPGSILLNKKYTVSTNQLRAVAHHISDLVYQQITGTRGVFSTKLAYVVVQRTEGAPTRYILEVADQDGYNPRPLLNSPEPIMSPAWSPNGRQIAYVSFENHRAGIYLEDVTTGGRRLLSEYDGINGAPAWSPDGSKIALVLSKSGAPNIYIMNVATGGLTQITHDFNINTEPSWAPDSKSLLFTSNRSGGPQIYQIKLASNTIERLTFDGDYNARASYTRDGRHIAMIHRVSGMYHIGILDLDAGTMRVLTGSASDSASPSIAPNGSMILYDTVAGGRNVLGMVSADGRVQLNLPARNGEAQDPAWSPFLS